MKKVKIGDYISVVKTGRIRSATVSEVTDSHVIAIGLVGSNRGGVFHQPEYKMKLSKIQKHKSGNGWHYGLGN